jgi:hypothetical protein
MCCPEAMGCPGAICCPGPGMLYWPGPDGMRTGPEWGCPLGVVGDGIGIPRALPGGGCSWDQRESLDEAIVS